MAYLPMPAITWTGSVPPQSNNIVVASSTFSNMPSPLVNAARPMTTPTSLAGDPGVGYSG